MPATTTCRPREIQLPRVLLPETTLPKSAAACSHCCRKSRYVASVVVADRPRCRYPTERCVPTGVILRELAMLHHKMITSSRIPTACISGTANCLMETRRNPMSGNLHRIKHGERESCPYRSESPRPADSPTLRSLTRHSACMPPQTLSDDLLERRLCLVSHVQNLPPSSTTPALPKNCRRY